jgi:hypothetical protein
MAYGNMIEVKRNENNHLLKHLTLRYSKILSAQGGVDKNACFLGQKWSQEFLTRYFFFLQQRVLTSILVRIV